MTDRIKPHDQHFDPVPQQHPQQAQHDAAVKKEHEAALAKPKIVEQRLEALEAVVFPVASESMSHNPDSIPPKPGITAGVKEASAKHHDEVK